MNEKDDLISKIQELLVDIAKDIGSGKIKLGERKRTKLRDIKVFNHN